MKAETVIREAIAAALEKGLRIEPTAMISWMGPGGSPVTCDAIGAVVLHHGIQSKNFPKGWGKKLHEVLGEDAWWVHRFGMGFNRKYQILIYIYKKDSDVVEKTIPDDVAALGIKLRKQFCPEWCK